MHDSSDYYQLKISIFTDDKKTDLVGEAWIDLKNIIVTGGGQADVWQSLSCKGKYAGEIRLEITFYDSRPKPDKPPVKAKQPSPADLDAQRQRTSPIKRRPLPSDPVTGEAPPAAPIPVSTMPPSNQEYYAHQQTPPRHTKQSSHSAMIPTQSPLQAMEYNNTPPQGARQQSNAYSNSPGAPAALGYSTTPSRQPHRSRDHHETVPRPVEAPAYDFPDEPPQFGHSDRHELHMGDRHLPSLDASQPPPPPPAHRSRHSSVGPESPQVSPIKTAPSTPMRRDVLKNEAHRHTASVSSTRPLYSHHDVPSSPHSPMTYTTPSPRHQSYDAGYGGRSLHATVEDVPDSPTPDMPSSYRSRYESEPAYERDHRDHRDQRDQRDPSPAPYERSSPQPQPLPTYQNQSPRHNASHHDAQEYDRSYRRSPSPLPGPGRGYDGSSHGTPQHRQITYDRDYDRDYDNAQASRAPPYGGPGPQSSLQHTVDPRLARDVPERIHEERHYDSRLAGQQVSQVRGRQRSEPPPSYGAPSPGYTPNRHDRRGSSITFSGGPQEFQPREPRGHGRNISASPAHAIPRKSVSPAPPADDGHHVSEMPFGPDSYDALNPSMVSSRSSNSALSNHPPTQERPEPQGKIVTYDGREVDPSDHLPIESWAPEPEPKAPQMPPSSDHARRSPGGAQPLPPSGRRLMRLSRVETAPALSYGHHDEPHTPLAPSGGRNRLQKKAPRGASVSPGMSSPLAPIHPENYQDRQSPYGSHDRPGHTHRGSYDYPSENYAPPHYGNGPPIPAKIPLMSGANGGDIALLEEMQRIDIGTGRSRRRGGY